MKIKLEGVVARTVILDREVKRYLEQYPDAVCISPGCGLDTRYQRIRPEKIWNTFAMD